MGESAGLLGLGGCVCTHTDSYTGTQSHKHAKLLLAYPKLEERKGSVPKRESAMVCLLAWCWLLAWCFAVYGCGLGGWDEMHAPPKQKVHKNHEQNRTSNCNN